MTRLQGWVASVSPPTPSAPAEVERGLSKALGLAMYVSIAACVGVLVLAGVWAAAGSQGHGSGVTPELQRKVVGVVIALVVIASASGITNFFLG
jgi:hypothetical protein